MRNKRFFWLLCVLLLLPSTLCAQYSSENWKVPANLPEYKVIEVIDGDTINLEKKGKVRYIGVNTPELHHPTKGLEPYGKEAFEVNKRLVSGKKVKIQFDVGEKDRYGRYLAYVYVGTIFVNAYLVESGYAQVMTIAPNVKYANLFKSLQREAAQAQRGLWKPAPPFQPEPGRQYVASKKSTKFHRPDCHWAQEIKAENQVVFKSREEAIQAGYSPCTVCNP